MIASRLSFSSIFIYFIRFRLIVVSVLQRYIFPVEKSTQKVGKYLSRPENGVIHIADADKGPHSYEGRGLREGRHVAVEAHAAVKGGVVKLQDCGVETKTASGQTVEGVADDGGVEPVGMGAVDA